MSVLSSGAWLGTCNPGQWDWGENGGEVGEAEKHCWEVRCHDGDAPGWAVKMRLIVSTWPYWKFPEKPCLRESVEVRKEEGVYQPACLSLSVWSAFVPWQVIFLFLKAECQRNGWRMENISDVAKHGIVVAKYKRKGREQVGRSRTEVCFSDFTPASKLLDVSRLIIFVSILLQRSSGDLGGRYLLLSATHPWTSRLAMNW